MSFGKTMGLRRVVITGVGMVTSMGMDVPTVWSRLLAGKSGVSRAEPVLTPHVMERYRIPSDFPIIGGVMRRF